jgi:hypothetical protein
MSPTASDPNFQAIFNAAVEAYKRKTKEDIASHPLADELKPCTSPNDIIAVLQQRALEFEKSRSADQRLKWLTPTINVLYAFSATLGEGVGLVSTNTLVRNWCSNVHVQVFPPAKVISAGIGVLLLVGIFLILPWYAIVTLMYFRRPKMSTPAKNHLLSSSSILKRFSSVLKSMQRSHQLLL